MAATALGHQELKKIPPSLTAKAFFDDFVFKRQPVVFSGLIDDEGFKGKDWADSQLEYLSKKAGNVTVMLEPIHAASNQFGTDTPRIAMAFKNFLSSLQSADGPQHYLTTQYAFEEDEVDGPTGSITSFPPPTNALTDDFPQVPRLMGNLALQQVNLWLGKSKDGSSSGLHHDFHDNLYILLSGAKRFVLYPPAEHVHLHPHGTLHEFHSNGLISYQDAPVRSDGLPLRIAVGARVKAIEQKLEELGGSGKNKGKGKQQGSEWTKWMKMHDEALDELAQVTLDAADEEDFGLGEGEEDDFDALMAGLEDGDEEDEEEAGPSSKLKGATTDEDHEEDEDDLASSDEDAEDKDKLAESSGEPSSFSRIPTYILHTHLGLPTTALPPPSPSWFPSLAEAGTPYVVHLKAGEMLYLPASWWHEVTSTSPAAASEGDGNPDVHMAFNYWFYPPTSQSFEQPYEDTLVWDYLRPKRADVVTKRKSGQDEERKGKKAKR